MVHRAVQISARPVLVVTPANAVVDSLLDRLVQSPLLEGPGVSCWGRDENLDPTYRKYWISEKVRDDFPISGAWRRATKRIRAETTIHVATTITTVSQFSKKKNDDDDDDGLSFSLASCSTKVVAPWSRTRSV